MAVAALVPGRSRQARTAEEEFGTAAVWRDPSASLVPAERRGRRGEGLPLRSASAAETWGCSPAAQRYGWYRRRLRPGTGGQGRLPFPIRGAPARALPSRASPHGNGFGGPARAAWVVWRGQASSWVRVLRGPGSPGSADGGGAWSSPQDGSRPGSLTGGRRPAVL
jgi:hypothetical protein